MINNGLRPYETYIDTGTDWLENIPAHWEKMSIRAITELSNKRYGLRDDLELLSVYREFGVVRKNSRDDNHNVESLDLSNYKYVHKGDLVLNKMKMWQGSLGVSKYEGIVSPAYIVCKIKGNINLEYLHLLLRSPKYKTIYNRISYGIRIGQWDMRYDDFKKINLFIPPRSEQDQIVKYLDHKLAKINKFIKAKKKLIAVLKEQKQAIINEAVTKGMDPNVKMKTSGIEWLGDVPEHWQKDKANRLFRRIGSGTTPSSGTTKYYNGNIKWINSGDLNDDYLLDTRKTVSKIALADYSVLQVYPKKSIVVAMYGATIGKLSITEFEACCNQACCVLGNLKSIVNLEYAFYSLYGCKSSLIEKSRGGGQPNISQEIIKQTWLPIPPMSEQAVIVNHIRKSTEFIESCILRVSNEIKLILEYKNSLISEVVTGKVDVRKIAINESEEEIVEDTELDEDLINEESLKAEDGDE